MIRLLPQDAALLAAVKQGLPLPTGARVEERDAEHVAELINQTLRFQERVGATPPWIGYLTVRESDALVIGCCGFKGDPGADQMVEIAYHTFERFEGQGLATAAALGMFDLAAETGDVRVVRAHTLPERNASCRILEKCGFRHLGEVTDPEDGQIWRWERATDAR